MVHQAEEEDTLVEEAALQIKLEVVGAPIAVVRVVLALLVGT